MKDVTMFRVFRWIHIVCSIPILGYVYSPFDVIPSYAPATRLFFLPVMLLTGLWMWKGHLVRRLVSRKPARGPESPDRLSSPWRLHAPWRWRP